MNTLFRRVWHGQEGKVLYLFAALLVVLLGMAAMSIDIGFAIHAQRELQASADAVATGARTLATNRAAPSGNPCTLGETALKNAAYNLNQSLITIQPETFTGGGGSTCAALQPNDAVTMSATYPCDMTIPFLGSFWASCALSSQTTVRIE